LIDCRIGNYKGTSIALTQKRAQLHKGVIKMDDILESIENLPSSVYYGGVLGSIALSVFLFMSGKRETGIFVGLWAPTILNLGLYNKMLRVEIKPTKED